MNERVLSLTWMEAGQSGTIMQIQGGIGLVGRLAALGVRPGKRITKISSLFIRGPVIIEMDRAQLAIGFGMANRVIVKLEETKK